jgi:hypothetical protein
MAMFHACKFPVFNGANCVTEKTYIIRDGHYMDIIHDFVESWTVLKVEDWDQEGFPDVVLMKVGCVWIVTQMDDGPEELPDEYYRLKNIYDKNIRHKRRSHPYL